MRDITELTHSQSMRYSRHVMLPQLSFEGQERILASKVVVIGAGGLGCAALPYLASSGVGHLVVADHDHIETHNLQRQTLFSEADVGRFKAVAAQERLQALNPEPHIDAFTCKVDPLWLEQHLQDADAVLDCTDNLATRLLINSACVRHRVPLISGAAIRFEGQVISFLNTAESPCYGCMSRYFGEQELSCMEAGIFAPLVAIIGNLQALDALKLIAGLPVESGQLTLFDGLSSEWQQLKVPKHPACDICRA